MVDALRLSSPRGSQPRKEIPLNPPFVKGGKRKAQEGFFAWPQSQNNKSLFQAYYHHCTLYTLAAFPPVIIARSSVVRPSKNSSIFCCEIGQVASRWG